MPRINPGVAIARQRKQQAAEKPFSRGQASEGYPIPAPTGGWNTRDSLDTMKPEDAVNLENMIPGLGMVSSRGGTQSYATGLGAAVKTVAEFNAGSSRKMIAAANGKIWDISSAGAGVSLASGFADDNWSYQQFDDSSGGARGGLVNGSDAPQIYNGATIGAMAISGAGMTPANMNGLHIFKNRSYFWDDRTQDFWYSATNALGGVCSKFPLGRLAGTGGNMLGMGTWSRDSGNGPQDLAVFILSSGDVLVYAGDDPSSPSAWAIVGRYSLGGPISKRAVKKVGSDLLIVTRAGYVPLNRVLDAGRVNEQRGAISNKIRGAAIDAVKNYGSNFGWDIFHYPRGNQLIVNVPISSTRIEQHVMNTETGAWCKFTGISALCWALYNDLPYYGTPSGTVRRFDTGYNDDTGVAINVDAQTAFNYLGRKNRTKRLTAVRPLLRSTGAADSLTYTIGVGFDFNPIKVSSSSSSIAIAGSEWDLSDWDTSSWADDLINSSAWSSLTGAGYCMSCRLRFVSSTQGIDWFSTTFLAEMGGLI
jgi:hypothetical protein